MMDLFIFIIIMIVIDVFFLGGVTLAWQLDSELIIIFMFVVIMIVMSYA